MLPSPAYLRCRLISSPRAWYPITLGCRYSPDAYLSSVSEHSSLHVVAVLILGDLLFESMCVHVQGFSPVPSVCAWLCLHACSMFLCRCLRKHVCALCVRVSSCVPPLVHVHILWHTSCVSHASARGAACGAAGCESGQLAREIACDATTSGCGMRG